MTSIMPLRSGRRQNTKAQSHEAFFDEHFLCVFPSSCLIQVRSVSFNGNR